MKWVPLTIPLVLHFMLSGFIDKNEFTVRILIVIK